MEKQKTSLDDVLKKFSVFGRYHLQFTFFAILANATNSLYVANYVFAAEESGYRCVDETFANRTCGSVGGTRCTEWVYDNPHSFVAEFQLGCQEWKRTLVGTSHSFGYMLGLLVVGPLSDRIGRKPTLILTGVMGGVFGVARSFSKSYWLYIVLEFLGAFIGDVCSPMFVLNIEIVTAKKRAIYNCLSNFGYILGSILLVLAASSVPYWRNFLQTIYGPAFLFITYYFLLDESPRWLLMKEKKEKAIAILEKMGRKNKVVLDKDDLNRLLEEDKGKSISYASLLKMTFQSRALLMRFVICTVWWTTTTFVNYGLTINSVSLQGNKYLNFALVQAVDFPGIFIIMYILTKYKRKKPLICAFFAAAVMCFMQPFVPKGYPWLSVMVYMASKLMGSIFLSITYMYTSELFPTYTRNSMHAMCSSIGRIGSIIAPQTPLLVSYWSGLPTLMFGGASLAAGLVTFLVPDTADDALPDTVREAEDIGNKKKRGVIGIDNFAMVKD